MTKIEKADQICLRRFGMNFSSWLDKFLPGFTVVNEKLEIIKDIKGDDLVFLQQKNREIKTITGVDFMVWLKNCAQSETKCEIEARRFLRENYPHNDVDEDKRALGLFMKYYYEKEAEHELIAKSVVEKIHLKPDPPENIYDKTFRCKYLGNFVSDIDKLEFAMGFFPKD